MFIGLSVGQPDNFLIRGVFLIKKNLKLLREIPPERGEGRGKQPERGQGIPGSLFP